MVQNQEQPVGKITFSILIALSLSHCLNDLLQSVLSASYPLFKDDLGLSFAQIGLITLVYQLSASVFQPITGIIFDKYPVAWSLPIGMSFTMIGLINLAFSDNLYWILLSVFLIGIGSSVLHPEASRITFLASGGKRGLAQSLFQVGGNFGGSLGPLLVALLVAPYGRQHLLIFAFVALAAIPLFVVILIIIPSDRVGTYIITQLLGKDVTLTFRTVIYSMLPSIMKGRWLWGFGYGTGYEVLMRHGIVDAQNGVFDWIQQIGIFGTMLLVMWLCIAMKRPKNDYKINYSDVRALTALIYVFVLMATVEITFSSDFLATVVLLYGIKMQRIQEGEILK